MASRAGRVIDPTTASSGRVPSGLGRCQYAGGWGYESPAADGFPGAAGGLILAGVSPTLPPITLMHVGARWYAPSLGRFLQRDPIGIRGGRNAYAYCLNTSTARVDPLGLWDDSGLELFWEQFHNGSEDYRRGARQAAAAGAVARGLVLGGAAAAGGAAGAAGGIGGTGGLAVVGCVINGFTRHGINQLISRGVAPQAILDAVCNPLAIQQQAEGVVK